jgi:hypothetical protein
VATYFSIKPIQEQEKNLAESLLSGGDLDQNQLDIILTSKANSGIITEKLNSVDFNPYSQTINDIVSWIFSLLCLAPGTLIRTPSGNRPVEELQIGDLVLTLDGPQPLKFLGTSSRHVNYIRPTGRMPVRITAGGIW